jgi:phytoene dehydrogenase-like protein
VKKRNYISAYRAFLKLISPRTEADVGPYDEIPLEQFLLRYTDDFEFHRFIGMVCALLLVVGTAEASTGEFMWCFSKWARDASASYPKGGFREISQSFLRACQRDGGRILFDEKAAAIRVENGRVLGVETDKDFYPADVAACNAGIQKAVALAGEKNFPPEYLKKVKSLKYSASGLTVKYAVDFKPLDLPVMIHYEPGFDLSRFLSEAGSGTVPERPVLFITSPTVSDPELAPPGKHLLLAATIVPDSLSSPAIAEKMLDNMERKMNGLFPGLENRALWKQRTALPHVKAMSGRAQFDCVGVAQNWDQIGRNKPSPQTPVSGLYIVGCDAGGRGIGTEQASDSALKTSELIVRSFS